MPIETATYINQLDPAIPTGGNKKYEGDDNLRLIKQVLTNSFPNVGGVVSLTHTQLNALARAILTADGTGLTVPAVATRANKLMAFDASGMADTSRGFADLDAAIAIALAVGNFKGNWSSLTGALNTPASVKHNNRYWALLNNLANVALSQPGVTADWQLLTEGVMPQQTVAGSTVSALVGIEYVLTGPACAVTAPVGPQDGDPFSVAPANGLITNTILFGAASFICPGGTFTGTLTMELRLPMLFRYSSTLTAWVLR